MIKNKEKMKDNIKVVYIVTLTYVTKSKNNKGVYHTQTAGAYSKRSDAVSKALEFKDYAVNNFGFDSAKTDANPFMNSDCLELNSKNETISKMCDIDIYALKLK